MLTYKSLLLFIIFILTLPISSWSLQKEHQVFFKFDKYTLSEIEKTKLDAVVKDLIKNEALWIKGFADSYGSENYNLELSRKRAEAVFNYLSKSSKFDLNSIKLTPIGIDKSANLKNSLKRRVELFGGTYSEVFNKPDLAIINPQKDESSSEKVESNAERSISSVEEINSAIEEKKTTAADKESNSSINQESKTSVIEEKNSVFHKSEDVFEHENQKNRYYVLLGLYNNVIEAEDRGSGGLARWVSNENIDLEASYQYQLRKKLWIGARASYHVQDYEVELNPLFTWDENIENLFRLSVVSDYETKKWGLGLDLDYNGEQFIYEQAFNVELRDIYLFGISLRAKYKLFSTKNWSSRVGLKFELPLLSSNQIDPSGEFGLIGYLDISKRRWVKKHGVHCRLFYGVRKYTNDQNDQNEEVVGLKCGIRSFSWL